MTQQSVNIRELDPSQVEKFMQLRLRGLREEPLAFTATYEDTLALPASELAKRLIVSADSFVLGAFDGDELVGMSGFYRYKEGAKVAHRGLIWGVYLAPEYRGGGVAKRMLTQIIDKARALGGIEIIHLGVNAANLPVVKLYQSLGFETWGCDPHALKVDGQYVDELRMVLRL